MAWCCCTQGRDLPKMKRNEERFTASWKKTNYADVWKHPAWATERTAWRSKAMTWIFCQLGISEKMHQTKKTITIVLCLLQTPKKKLPPSNAGSLETWQDLLILLMLSWAVVHHTGQNLNGQRGGFHQIHAHSLKHFLNIYKAICIQFVTCYCCCAWIDLTTNYASQVSASQFHIFQKTLNVKCICSKITCPNVHTCHVRLC